MFHTEASSEFSSDFQVEPFDCQGSAAERTPSAKKRGSYVGHIIDPFRGRKIYFESLLEFQWASVWVADHRVAEVREQQYVKYWDGDCVRIHCLDFALRLKNGQRVGHSTKYAEDVKRTNLEKIIGAVNAFRENRRVADDFRITREIDLNIQDVKNARRIIACGKMRDHEAQAYIRQSLPELPEVVSPREIALHLRMGRRGERAAIALLQSGCLQLRDHMEITIDAPFVNLRK
jgi:hypothetical protein